jgi:Ca2+/Na+ antiporter
MFCDEHTDYDNEDLIDFYWLYCSSDPSARGFVVFLVICSVFLFMSILGTTAENHFVPVLQVVAALCKMRPDVAGVTLLAVGNGAPDIMTAQAGLSAGNFGIVIGNLLGGSNFITMFIMGCVLYTARQEDTTSVDKEDGGALKVEPLPFLRDMISFIIFIGLIFAFACTGELRFEHACILLVLYCIYIIFVFQTGKYQQTIEQAEHDLNPQIDANMFPNSHLKRRRISTDTSVNSSVSITVSERRHISQDMGSRHGSRGSRIASDATRAGLPSRTHSRAAHTNLLLHQLLDREDGDNDDVVEDRGDALVGVDLPDEPCCGAEMEDEDDLDADDKLSKTGGHIEIRGGSSVNTTSSIYSTIVQKSWIEVFWLLSNQLNLVTVWIQYCFEFPFSIMRVLTIPSADMGWGPRRRIATSVCFAGCIMITLVDFLGLDIGYLTYVIGLSIGASIGLTFYVTTTDFGSGDNKSLQSIADDIAAKFLTSPEEGTANESLLSEGAIQSQDDDAIDGVLGGAQDAAKISGNLASPIRARSYWLIPLLLVAFISSIVWLDFFANFVVNASLLTAEISGLSSVIIGLTIVAWGNSIGDLVADVAVAKAGLPYTAITSCMCSPLLSAIIGVGSAILILCARDGIDTVVKVQMTPTIYVSYGFLLLSQILTLSLTIMNNYAIPYWHTKILWGIYVTFLISSIIIEATTGNNNDED